MASSDEDTARRLDFAEWPDVVVSDVNWIRDLLASAASKGWGCTVEDDESVVSAIYLAIVADDTVMSRKRETV